MTNPARDAAGSTSRFQEELRRRAALVEEALDQLLPGAEAYPPVIHQAIRYSALGGGKRLRGSLVMAAAGAVGGREEDALPVAAAVEMIHAYSLVHDDLPAMDDDDMRRGKPTCHRVYGEAMAILAGDALLTHAFQVVADMSARGGLDAPRALRIVAELARAGGTMGLIGGQVVDLQSEGKREITEDVVEYIHSHKTGALFAASLVCGGLAGGAGEDQLTALRSYGQRLGLAFQIIDDVLDVGGDEKAIGKRVGSDARRQKATYVSLYGVEGARRRAEVLVGQAKATLSALMPSSSRTFLEELADFVVQRDR